MNLNPTTTTEKATAQHEAEMRAETPRTDAVACPFEDLPDEPGGDWVVPADFARELERELAAVRAENGQLKSQISDLTKQPKPL